MVRFIRIDNKIVKYEVEQLVFMKAREVDCYCYWSKNWLNRSDDMYISQEETEEEKNSRKREEKVNENTH